MHRFAVSVYFTANIANLGTLVSTWTECIPANMVSAVTSSKRDGDHEVGYHRWQRPCKTAAGISSAIRPGFEFRDPYASAISSHRRFFGSAAQ